MPIAAPLFLALVAAAAGDTPATDAPPTAEQVHQSVEKSLVFLDKSGTDWWNKSKCASCHHVPMSIWSLSEAKNRGFAVNEDSLDQLRNWAVPSYSDHPKLRPVGQDGDDKTLSLNTIYLTQAVTATKTLDDPTIAALKKFADHLLAAQDANGSWKSSATLPPVGDVTEVRTMQVLLALQASHDRGLVETDRWTPARDRALAWLHDNKFKDENQTLNLRIQITKRFGKAEDLQPLVKELLDQQEADGGWSQTRVRPSGDLKEYDEDKKPAVATAEVKGGEAKAAETKPADNKVAETKAAEAKPAEATKPAEAKPAQPKAAEIKARPSDALATGQSLYALTLAGVDPQQPAIQRAQAYLLRTQTAAGSWLVPIRSQKNKGIALTHYGTGWAAIGLMQTLPAQAGKPETAQVSVSAGAK